MNDDDKTRVDFPKLKTEKNIPTFKEYTKEKTEFLTAFIPVIKKALPEFKETGKRKKDKKKRKKFNIFNTKTAFTLLFLCLIITGISIKRSYSLQNEVDDYEKYFVEIDEKDSTDINIYNEDDNNIDSLRSSKASKIVSCIENNLTEENMPDSLKEIINELNEYYNESNNYFAFKYYDIYTGFTVSYNENQNIFTASSIKAPACIYIYEKAANNEVDLNEKLLYTSNLYSKGSGYIKYSEANTYWDVKTLVSYAILYSDNIAYHMLMNRYGINTLKDYWETKGTTAIYENNNIWGQTNAHDATIYMKELYDFYNQNNEYGNELMNYFIQNTAKFISSPEDKPIASKSGWAGSAVHDIAIVFDENPYIVVALSNLGDTENFRSYFAKASDFAYRIHKEYWNYKLNECQS